MSQSVRRDFPVADVERKLQQLVDEARGGAGRYHSGAATGCAHRTVLQDTGFGGASGVYRLSDAIWLDKVLEARQGTPVSLGTIFLHIANALDLPLLPVIFPTQLILRADWLDEELWLINPLNGETLSEHQLEVWIKGNRGWAPSWKTTISTSRRTSWWCARCSIR